MIRMYSSVIMLGKNISTLLDARYTYGTPSGHKSYSTEDTFGRVNQKEKRVV